MMIDFARDDEAPACFALFRFRLSFGCECTVEREFAPALCHLSAMRTRVAGDVMACSVRTNAKRFFRRCCCTSEKIVDASLVLCERLNP